MGEKIWIDASDELLNQSEAMDDKKIYIRANMSEGYLECVGTIWTYVTSDRKKVAVTLSGSAPDENGVPYVAWLYLSKDEIEKIKPVADGVEYEYAFVVDRTV